MVRLVIVILVCVALGIGASPVAKSSIEDSGTISFGFYELLPGVFEVPLEKDTTTAKAPTEVANPEVAPKERTDDFISIGEGVPVVFMNADAVIPTEDYDYDVISTDGAIDTISTEKSVPVLFMDPDLVFAMDNQSSSEAPLQASDDGSGVGTLLFFPGADGSSKRVVGPSNHETTITAAPTTTTAAPMTTTANTTTAMEPADNDDGESFVFPAHISLDESFDDVAGEEEKGPPGFPGRSNGRKKGSCLLKDGLVVFNGTCEILLARNTCAEGEWLVMLEGEPQCVARPCPWGQVPFKDHCVKADDLSVCDSGQILYVSLSGEALCDCDHGFLYDTWSGNCYARHEKGSCNFGEYIDVSESGQVTCVSNPCVSDGYVKNPELGVCYRKMYGGFCPTLDLIFHYRNRTAECREIASHNILDVHELRKCPPGSIRDYLNVCREAFHIPTLTSYPMLYGGCPGGFIRDPKGTCRKTTRLFG